MVICLAYASLLGLAIGWAAPLVFASKAAATVGKAVQWLALAVMVVHILAAYGWHHGWSHQAAVAYTARQTLQTIGWNWGGGIYFNFLFMGLWFVDLLWPRRDLPEAASVSSPWRIALRAYLFFIAFQATVVFGHGLPRLCSALVCLGLLCLWLYCRARGPLFASQPV